MLFFLGIRIAYASISIECHSWQQKQQQQRQKLDLYAFDLSIQINKIRSVYVICSPRPLFAEEEKNNSMNALKSRQQQSQQRKTK